MQNGQKIEKYRNFPEKWEFCQKIGQNRNA